MDFTPRGRRGRLCTPNPIQVFHRNAYLKSGLLPNRLLNFPHKVLQFACIFLNCTFGFQVGIISSLSDFLFYRALYFVDLSLSFNVGTWFHHDVLLLSLIRYGIVTASAEALPV